MENNPFITLCLRIQFFTRCGKSFFNVVDLFMLSLTCKSLNELFPKNILENKKSDLNGKYKLNGSEAARFGYFKLVDYIYKNGMLNYFKSESIDLTFVPYSNEDEEQQLLMIREHYDKKHFYLSKYCIKNGNLKLLKWLKENEYLCNKNLYHYAAEFGNIDILKWLKEINYPKRDDVCTVAARCGHLEALQWIIENGEKLPDDICDFIGNSGNIELLKWAIGKNCSLSTWICAYAARNGHLEFIKYARKNNCPWDIYTSNNALLSGNHEILKWLKENGCPY